MLQFSIKKKKTTKITLTTEEQGSFGQNMKNDQIILKNNLLSSLHCIVLVIAKYLLILVYSQRDFLVIFVLYQPVFIYFDFYLTLTLIPII